MVREIEVNGAIKRSKTPVSQSKLELNASRMPLVLERREERKQASGFAGRLIQYSNRIPVAQKYADLLLEKTGAHAVYIETKGSTVLSGENGINRDRLAYQRAVKQLAKNTKDKQRKVTEKLKLKDPDAAEASQPDLIHYISQDGKMTLISVKINPHTFVHVNLENEPDAEKLTQKIWPLLQKFRIQLRGISNQEKAFYSATTGLGSKVAMELHEENLRKTENWKNGSLGFFDLVKFKSANDK